MGMWAFVARWIARRQVNRRLRKLRQYDREHTFTYSLL